jgi:hypothetical protein
MGGRPATPPLTPPRPCVPLQRNGIVSALDLHLPVLASSSTPSCCRLNSPVNLSRPCDPPYPSARGSTAPCGFKARDYRGVCRSALLVLQDGEMSCMGVRPATPPLTPPRPCVPLQRKSCMQPLGLHLLALALMSAPSCCRLPPPVDVTCPCDLPYHSAYGSPAPSGLAARDYRGVCRSALLVLLEGEASCMGRMHTQSPLSSPKLKVGGHYLT